VYQNTWPDRRPTPCYTARRRQQTLPGREDRHPRGACLFPFRLLIAFAPHTPSCQPLREETDNSSSLPHVSPSITPQTRVGYPRYSSQESYLNDRHHRLTHPQRETRTCSFILHNHTYQSTIRPGQHQLLWLNPPDETRTHHLSTDAHTILFFLYYTKTAGTEEHQRRTRGR
jgi:hypothetical protein